jgi:hypothetical protein
MISHRSMMEPSDAYSKTVKTPIAMPTNAPTIARAIVCAPCNTAKGSLSLGRFANRLARAGDPRALRVAAFMRFMGLPSTGYPCDKTEVRA